MDEALLTGEGVPVSKRGGDMVVAGSYNLEAPLIVRLERLGSESRFGEIVVLMARAASEKPRLALLADHYASRFLAGVLLLAVIAYVIWSFIDPARALWVAVSVLVVTCPCALSLATPAAVLATSGNLAKRGLLVCHPAALEALAAAGRIVFDKTGTLTSNRLALKSIQVLRADVDADRALAIAAAMEQGSLHPIGIALQLAMCASPAACGLALAMAPEALCASIRGGGVEAATLGGTYLPLRLYPIRMARLRGDRNTRRDWPARRPRGTAGADVLSARLCARTPVRRSMHSSRSRWRSACCRATGRKR